MAWQNCWVLACSHEHRDCWVPASMSCLLPTLPKCCALSHIVRFPLHVPRRVVQHNLRPFDALDSGTTMTSFVDAVG